MAFEELREQVKDQLQSLWVQIQDSSTFQTLRERYEVLPQQQQRLILAAGASLVALLLVSFPYSYLSSASSAVSEFEENRLLIRELLRAGRTAQDVSPLPPSIETAQAQSQIRAALGGLSLLDEQKGAIQTFEPQAGDPDFMASPPIQQQGVSVELRNLNVRQIAEVGQSLERRLSHLKLVGLEVREANQADKPLYYNVTYSFLGFALPSLSPQEASPPLTGRGRRGP